MSRRCEICRKKAMSGASVSRRGLKKVKGGVGLKTTGITKRKFFPNLQAKRLVIDGKVKKVSVCTKCIKKGNLALPSKAAKSSS